MSPTADDLGPTNKKRGIGEKWRGKVIRTIVKIAKIALEMVRRYPGGVDVRSFIFVCLRQLYWDILQSFIYIVWGDS